MHYHYNLEYDPATEILCFFMTGAFTDAYITAALLNLCNNFKWHIVRVYNTVPQTPFCIYNSTMG